MDVVCFVVETPEECRDTAGASGEGHQVNDVWGSIDMGGTSSVLIGFPSRPCSSCTLFARNDSFIVRCCCVMFLSPVFGWELDRNVISHWVLSTTGHYDGH